MKLKDIFHRKRASGVAGDSTDGGNVMYELWGCNTDSHFATFCGVFDNYEVAKTELDKYEKAALPQREELRDTFWIEETTAAKVAERERKEKEYYTECRKEKSYVPRHLQKVFNQSLDNFISFLGKNKENPRLEMRLGVLWDHKADCFSQIGFELGKSETYNAYYVTESVEIKRSRHYIGGGVSAVVLRDETIGGLLTKFQEPVVREHLLSIAGSLIKDHFKGERA